MASRFRSAVRILCSTAVLLYPFWAWWGLSHCGIAQVVTLLAAVATLRAFVAPAPGTRLVALAACGLTAAALLFEDATPALLYPVIVNTAMLGLFATSLFSNQTIVERLARLRTPDLPPEGVRWCRGVTLLWCGFFIVNGLIALGTVIHGDLNLWALWNGFLSYIAMGSLFAGEWVARTFVQRQRRKAP